MLDRLRQWSVSNGLGTGFFIFVGLFAVVMIWLIITLVQSLIGGLYTNNTEPLEIVVYKEMTVAAFASYINEDPLFGGDDDQVIDKQRMLLYIEQKTGWDPYYYKVFPGVYTIPPKTKMEDLVKIMDRQMNYRKLEKE